MRRGSLFWGAILVILGILILLDNLGVLAGVSIWNVFWPLLLIFRIYSGIKPDEH